MTMKTFYVGVKGLIVKDNRILLLRANKDQGRRDIWEIPGGRIDGNETLQQTVTRELQEELPNIKNIQIGNIVHAERLPWDIDGTNSLTLVFVKVSADFEGNPQISDEHVDWRWCTEPEALELVNEFTSTAVKTAFA